MFQLTTLLTVGLCSLLLGCDGFSWSELGSPAEQESAYEIELVSRDNCPLPSHLDPKNVEIWSYRLRIVGRWAKKVPANYFYASLLTSDGARYLPTYYGCGPLLSAAPLGVGEKADGFVNFSIPPSKTPKSLVYAPELLGMNADEATKTLVLNGSQDQSAQDEETP